MTDFILLETGDALLQETGDNLLLDLISAIGSSIDFNNGIITSAKITATFTGTSPNLSMTADGINFESVTNGVTHTFTNTGTDLRWKADGSGGTTITKILINGYH